MTSTPQPPASPLGAQILPVTPFAQNCSLVWCTRTKDAVLIDPGGETPRLLTAVKDAGVTLKAVWLTHGHLDHAGGAAAIQRETGVDIIGPHREDAFWIDQIPEHGAKYGWTDPESCTPTRWLQDGDTVSVGDIAFDVVHCPGHTPGHVVFVNAALGIAFVGDVLFQGSVGRTDFPRSDPPALLRAIAHKLWPLGDHIQFVPGHGPMSTFGAEKQSNPFVSLEALQRAGIGASIS